jgi:hypothetical protein
MKYSAKKNEIMGRKQNVIVYLDRAGLNDIPSYVKEHGLTNGRSVENQAELITDVSSKIPVILYIDLFINTYMHANRMQ